MNYKNVDDNLWSFSTLNQSWSIVSLAPLNWIDLQYTSIPSMDKSFVFGPISEDESRLVEFDSGVSPLEPARLDTANVPTGSLHRGQLIHIPVPGGDGVLIEFGGAKDVAVGEYRDVSQNRDGCMENVKGLRRHLGRLRYSQSVRYGDRNVVYAENINGNRR